MLALTVTLVNFFTLAVWEIKQCHDSWSLVKTIMRVTIPVVTLIAVVAYWILALMLYLNYLN
jgi:drug/metabolite transporter superfamily protein YnfA